jgi:putative FmdB family regulatory protein
VPTYQYSCNDCGHFFETVQSFSDDSLTVCPECGGRLRKVFNAVGVVFKGSGFYRNDSRPQKSGAETGTPDGGSKKTAETTPSTTKSEGTSGSTSAPAASA